MSELLAADPVIDGRRVLIHEMDGPALVLGSAQRRAPEAAVPAGMELIRRRSGGGAVLLRPGDVVWVDVLLPRGDPLWVDDVGRSTWWLGDVWSAALGDLGLTTAVHRGPMVSTRWSDRVCFAGVGPGEVLLEGRKVVGISQRRDRLGSRFQCAALLRWAVSEMVGLFDLSPADEAARELQGAAAGLPVDGAALVAAVLNRLP